MCDINLKTIFQIALYHALKSGVKIMVPDPRRSAEVSC